MKSITALLLISVLILLCVCGAKDVSDDTYVFGKGFSGRGPYGPMPDFDIENMPSIEGELNSDRYHEWEKPPKAQLPDSEGTPPENAVETYETSRNEDIEKLLDNSEMIITNTYYKLDDGSFECRGYNYKYRIEVSGRLNNAKRDSRYIILSNTEDITFDQAWKASGLSSNINDYFSPEDAIIVERAGL